MNPTESPKEGENERAQPEEKGEGWVSSRGDYARRSKSCATTSTGRWPPCFDALLREKTPLPCSYARLRKLPLRCDRSGSYDGLRSVLAVMTSACIDGGMSSVGVTGSDDEPDLVVAAEFRRGGVTSLLAEDEAGRVDMRADERGGVRGSQSISRSEKSDSTSERVPPDDCDAQGEACVGCRGAATCCGRWRGWGKEVRRAD